MPGWSWADTRSAANRRTRTRSKGGVKSGKDCNTAVTCFGPLPGDCVPAGGLRVGRVLFAVAQVATKAVVVGSAGAGRARHGSGPPDRAPCSPGRLPPSRLRHGRHFATMTRADDAWLGKRARLRRA
jgi:hypothetical protein